MQIAFRADGDDQKGTGHLMRCAAIAAAFVQQGDAVCFYCSAASDTGAAWLRSKGVRVESLPVCDTVEQEAALLCARLRQTGTDILIIDSYWLSDAYFEIAAGAGALVAAIDDTALYRYHCDAVINGTLDAARMDYSACRVGRLLLGSRYSILREEFTQTPPGEVRAHAERVLVTMGGADIRSYTPVVIRALRAIPAIRVTVVYGPLMQNRREIEAAARDFAGTLEIAAQPASMAALMAQSDIAIAAGGGSTRELFCMGTPSLFILQADNQLPWRHFLETLGLGALCLGDYTQVKPADIQKAAEALLADEAQRRHIREIFLSFSQREGVHNIVSALKALRIEKNE